MNRRISRKQFIRNSFLAGAGAILMPNGRSSDTGTVMTVKGPMETTKMGFTLTHEHIMADFIGAAKFSKSRYSAEEVYTVALPFVKDAKVKGVDTFIDCTPAYLGRDPQILKHLADTTGMNILTTTGYYGAVNEKFVP